MGSSPLPIVVPTNPIAPRFKDMKLSKMKVSGAYCASDWIESGSEKMPVAVTSFDRIQAMRGCYCKKHIKRRLEQHGAEYL
jgi:hypothetical protein